MPDADDLADPVQAGDHRSRRTLLLAALGSRHLASPHEDLGR